jgi:DNA-binding transcriptional MerR regulator
MSPDQFLEKTGLADRTVRLYHQQGLLPPPGPGAQYDELHLLRVMAIPLLRGRGIRGPDRLRNALDEMSIQDLRRLVEGDEGSDESSDVGDAPAGLTSVPVAFFGEQAPQTGAPLSETHVHVKLRDGIVLDVRMPLDEEGEELVKRIVSLCGLNASFR